jgi:hypothetical protein
MRLRGTSTAARGTAGGGAARGAGDGGAPDGGSQARLSTQRPLWSGSNAAARGCLASHRRT